MTEGLVTVIIPVYNVEKYLERCLNSVINQTYKKLEIIIVDDGSTDKCSLICDKWAEKDGRIRVIHKKNEGLGMARNEGIKRASGKYMCFVDSDDYIALNAIEKAYVQAEKETADIVLFGVNNVNQNGKLVSCKVATTPLNVYEGKYITSDFLANLISANPEGTDWNLSMSACMCLFSSKVIRSNHCEFVSEREIISEDTFFLLNIYQYVSKVVVIKEALYFYCENCNSLTRTYREDRLEKINYFYGKSVELCNECGYSDMVIRQLDRLYLSFVIAAMKLLVNAEISDLKKIKMMKRFITDKQLQDVVLQINMKQESLSRRILLYAIKYKKNIIVYILVKAKAQKVLGDT